MTAQAAFGAQAKGSVSVARQADNSAANVLPIIRKVQAPSAKPLRAIADALNAHGVAAAQGDRLEAATERNALALRADPSGRAPTTTRYGSTKSR